MLNRMLVPHAWLPTLILDVHISFLHGNYSSTRHFSQLLSYCFLPFTEIITCISWSLSSFEFSYSKNMPCKPFFQHLLASGSLYTTLYGCYVIEHWTATLQEWWWGCCMVKWDRGSQLPAASLHNSLHDSQLLFWFAFESGFSAFWNDTESVHQLLPGSFLVHPWDKSEFW